MDDKMKVMAARLSEIASELKGMCAEMGGEGAPEEGDKGMEMNNEGDEPSPSSKPAAIILALKKGMKDEEE